MSNKHGKLNNNSTLRNDNNSYSNITNKVNKPKIKPDHKHKLLANIDQNEVNLINQKLDSHEDNYHNIDINDINLITNSLNKLLTNSAKKSGCYNKPSPKYNLSSAKFKKPWFNNKCLISRNKYRNAKNKYNSNKSTYNLATMTNLGKQYKKQLKVSRKNYCHNLNLKLRTCKLNNPKEYWKLLDIKHKNNEIKANFSDLVDHFKNLNNSSDT